MKKIDVYSTVILNNPNVNTCRNMSINEILSQAEFVFTWGHEKEPINLLYVQGNIIFTPYSGWMDNNINNILEQNYAVIHLQVPEDQIYLDNENDLTDDDVWEQIDQRIQKERVSVHQMKQIDIKQYNKMISESFCGFYIEKNPNYVVDVCIIKNPFDDVGDIPQSLQKQNPVFKVAAAYQKAFNICGGDVDHPNLFKNKNKYYKLIDDCITKYADIINNNDVTDLNDIW